MQDGFVPSLRRIHDCPAADARIQSAISPLIEGHTQAQPAAAADAPGSEGEHTVSSWHTGWCLLSPYSAVVAGRHWLVCILGLASCIQASPGPSWLPCSGESPTSHPQLTSDCTRTSLRSAANPGEHLLRPPCKICTPACSFSWTVRLLPHCLCMCLMLRLCPVQEAAGVSQGQQGQQAVHLCLPGRRRR